MRLTYIKAENGRASRFSDGDATERAEVPMLKSILVHLSGAKTDDAVLATALDIARPFGAHLECLHVVPDAATLMPRQGEIEIETAVQIGRAHV